MPLKRKPIPGGAGTASTGSAGASAAMPTKINSVWELLCLLGQLQHLVFENVTMKTRSVRGDEWGWEYQYGYKEINKKVYESTILTAGDYAELSTAFKRFACWDPLDYTGRENEWGKHNSAQAFALQFLIKVWQAKYERFQKQFDADSDIHSACRDAVLAIKRIMPSYEQDKKRVCLDAVSSLLWTLIPTHYVSCAQQGDEVNVDEEPVVFWDELEKLEAAFRGSIAADAEVASRWQAHELEFVRQLMGQGTDDDWQLYRLLNGIRGEDGSQGRYAGGMEYASSEIPKALKLVTAQSAHLTSVIQSQAAATAALQHELEMADCVVVANSGEQSTRAGMDLFSWREVVAQQFQTMASEGRGLFPLVKAVANDPLKYMEGFSESLMPISPLGVLHAFTDMLGTDSVILQYLQRRTDTLRQLLDATPIPSASIPTYSDDKAWGPYLRKGRVEHFHGECEDAMKQTQQLTKPFAEQVAPLAELRQQLEACREALFKMLGQGDHDTRLISQNITALAGAAVLWKEIVEKRVAAIVAKPDPDTADSDVADSNVAVESLETVKGRLAADIIACSTPSRARRIELLAPVKALVRELSPDIEIPTATPVVAVADDSAAAPAAEKPAKAMTVWELLTLLGQISQFVAEPEQPEPAVCADGSAPARADAGVASLSEAQAAGAADSGARISAFAAQAAAVARDDNTAVETDTQTPASPFTAANLQKLKEFHKRLTVWDPEVLEQGEWDQAGALYALRAIWIAKFEDFKRQLPADATVARAACDEAIQKLKVDLEPYSETETRDLNWFWQKLGEIEEEFVTAYTAAYVEESDSKQKAALTHWRAYENAFYFQATAVKNPLFQEKAAKPLMVTAMDELERCGIRECLVFVTGVSETGTEAEQACVKQAKNFQEPAHEFMQRELLLVRDALWVNDDVRALFEIMTAYLGAQNNEPLAPWLERAAEHYAALPLRAESLLNLLRGFTSTQATFGNVVGEYCQHLCSPEGYYQHAVTLWALYERVNACVQHFVGVQEQFIQDRTVQRRLRRKGMSEVKCRALLKEMLNPLIAPLITPSRHLAQIDMQLGELIKCTPEPAKSLFETASTTISTAVKHADKAVLPLSDVITLMETCRRELMALPQVEKRGLLTPRDAVTSAQVQQAIEFLRQLAEWIIQVLPQKVAQIAAGEGGKLLGAARIKKGIVERIMGRDAGAVAADVGVDDVSQTLEPIKQFMTDLIATTASDSARVPRAASPKEPKNPVAKLISVFGGGKGGAGRGGRGASRDTPSPKRR